MEASCAWLLESLRDPSPDSLPAVLAKHRSREDAFDLSDVVPFLPDKHLPVLAKSISEALRPTLDFFSVIADAASAEKQDDDADDRERHLSSLRGATEIIWHYVRDRKEPPIAQFRDIVLELHDILLAIPSAQCQNQVARICEWLWNTPGPQREVVAPQTLLFLLMRSFGEESSAADPDRKPKHAGGKVADIRRVYAMKKALVTLNLSAGDSRSSSMRMLLLRCSTSAAYLRVDEGRKYLAHLLTLEDMQEDVFEALVNQLASVRKTVAHWFGTVFLLAWKVQRSDWLADKLMNIAERAILAGSQPLATNLRTVLSSFHSNKRVTGVDLLLNTIYAPVLYRNLMVANPLVRRNAVMIMSDAFPIHDPGAMVQDIESTIDFQCAKLYELLDDPAPVVRRAAIQGTCRVLALFWELVPPASSKKMIDIITSRLAFDASAAHVRLAVFEGLQFLIDNHLAHQLLGATLPRLGRLINDHVEKVRLSFLDLLLTVKAKRIRFLRYFEIVPVDDLLRRLPMDSPAVATKIMGLLLTSYFPLERKGKTPEEVAASQTRACLSMLDTSREAARYFYKHVNLHVPPGPLCEFAMRLSSAALEAPALKRNADTEETSSRIRKGGKRPRRRTQRHRPEDEENEDPNVGVLPLDDEQYQKSSDNKIDRVTLLVTVADVLVSITPSLAKEANSRLKEYVEDIFGGEALKPLLLERGNALLSRASCWRIASCLDPSKARPLTVLWREQMDAVAEWRRGSEADVQKYSCMLSSLMLCGIRWNLFTQLSAIFSSWSDAAISGRRTSRIGVKARKRSRGRSRQKSSRLDASTAGECSSSTRSNALFALHAAADVIAEDDEFQKEFVRQLSISSSASAHSTETPSKSTLLTSAIRKGCLGAVDFVIENSNDASEKETMPSHHLLLRALSEAWAVSSMVVSSFPEDEYALGELRELLQWSLNVELWMQAFRVNEAFGVAFCSICLTHSADVAALEYMNDEDLLHVKTMSQRMLSVVRISDPRKVSRPVLDMLRMSFHLREHCLQNNQSEDDNTRRCDSSALRSTSKALLVAACQLLAECSTEEERITGVPVRPSAVEGFLGQILAEMSLEEDPKDFRDVFADSMRTAFDDVDGAERNLLAAFVCNTITALASSTIHKKSSAACRVYASVIKSMRSGVDTALSDKAVANFGYFVSMSLYKYYSDDEGPKTPVPSDGARDFFRVVENSVETEFPEPGGEDGGATAVEEVVETRKTLSALRNITEQDVGRGPPRTGTYGRQAFNTDDTDTNPQQSQEQ